MEKMDEQMANRVVDLIERGHDWADGRFCCTTYSYKNGCFVEITKEKHDDKEFIINISRYELINKIMSRTVEDFKSLLASEYKI